MPHATTNATIPAAEGEGHAARSWAVVGGGMLGMTMALRLAEAGKQVVLYESSQHLGGLADAWELGPVTWDRHYHVTLLSDSYLRQILKELELDASMEWVETKTGFYTDGGLHSVSNSLEFLTFPPLKLIDKLRLAWTIWYGSKIKDWRRLERVPVADWLRRNSGGRTFDKIWLPLLRAKLGENYERTSAAFIWATIQRLYAARRTGLKKEMFGYLPGGYGRIVRVFQERLTELGVDIRVNCSVASIRMVSPDERRDIAGVGGARQQPTGCLAQLELSDGTHITAERVVVTVPSQIATRLLPEMSPDQRRKHQQIEYQSLVCASLLLTRPLSDYYVVNITEQDVPFTGVIEMTALVNPTHFQGHSLVYLPKYVPAGDPILSASDDEVRDEFLTGLLRMYPDMNPDKELLAFRVSRVPHVMALSTLGYSKNVPSPETGIPGVSVVNSAQIVNGTLNVNETVKLAELATAKLLEDAEKSRLRSRR